MELLRGFKDHLLGPKNTASKVTVKNYVADVRKFILWFEKTHGKPFNPSLVNLETINNFKANNASLVSASSLERYLSSLRKFYSFLKEARVVNIGPFDSIQTVEKPNNDLWHINEFKNYLYSNNASRLTIKNYVIDIKQFIEWIEQSTTTSEIFRTINNAIIEDYKQFLFDQKKLSPLSINRKLSSLRKYISWSCEKGYSNFLTVSTHVNNLPKPLGEQKLVDIALEIEQKYLQTFHAGIAEKPVVVNKPYSSIPPIRLFQKFLWLQNSLIEITIVAPIAKISLVARQIFWVLRGKPLFVRTKTGPHNFVATVLNPKGIKNIVIREKSIRNIFHGLYKSTPEWYKNYQNRALLYYLNLVILTIFISAFAFGLYTKFVLEPRIKTQALAALPTAPPRTLSFHGRLTDSSNNPITSRSDLRFAIYNSPTATGSALVWQENISIIPDIDGIFSTQLGNNRIIPTSLFSQNTPLWIGVSVAQSSELIPRQQLATVSYASNSQTLQGLMPITQAGAGISNVVLALDSSGNLTIGGSANPVFQATGGQFKLSGEPLVLTTNPGSNGTIQISPDGSGQIDLQRPLTNSTSNNNILSASGAVEVDDLFAVLATSSGQSAFTINQTGTGPIISASTAGVSRFTVDNNGNVGIGSGNPTVPLQVFSNGNNFALGNNTNTQTFMSINANRTMLGYDGSNAILQSGLSHGIKFNVNNNSFGNGTAMILTSSGNLGIGTASPSSFMLQVAGSIGPDSTDAYNLGSATNEWNNLYVKNIISPSSGGIAGYWQLTGGTLAPSNISNDLLIGGIATNSAKFQVLGISGNATTSGNLTFNSSTPMITTTNMAPLVLGSLSTGAIQLSPKGTTGLFLSTSGNVGIGTTVPTDKLDIVSGGINLETSGKTLNFASGVAGNTFNIQIPNKTAGDTCGSGKTQGVIFQDVSNTNAQVGHICLGGGQLEFYAHGFTATATDLAENYSDKNNDLNPGDIVSVDDTLIKGVKKTTSEYQDIMIGAVSTSPGVTLSDIGETGGLTNLVNPKPIALSGRVPIKVSTINGTIHIGDPLSASSISGVAMRSTKPGIIIGRALETYSNDNPQTIGKILVFVHVGWFDPGISIASNGQLSIHSQNTHFVVGDTNGTILTNTAAFAKAIIANLQTGLLHTQDALVHTLSATTANIAELTADKIVSPVAEIDHLHTRIISPVGEDGSIALQVNNDAIEVKNSATESAVAKIDNKGNESLSGNLQVNKDATISGTLHAGKIFADEIVGLHSATQSPTYITNVTNIYDATPSGDVTANPVATNSSAISSTITTPIAIPTNATSGATLYQVQNEVNQQTSFTNLASYSGYLSFVPHLQNSTFDPTGLDNSQNQSFSDLSVGGSISVGNRLVLAETSINVLGSDLALQPLKQGGVSIADGQVYIDSNGNLSVNGSATFTGNLAANIISPIGDHNLTLSLNNVNATSSANVVQPQLDVKNASGSGVFAINQLGDIIASGAATVSKLNLQVAQTALALSDTEQVASGSAGTATITPHHTELTIDTPLVTEHSLIYITPVGPTEGNMPYLLRQIPKKSFSVGIQVPTTSATVFNWLIIN